MLAADSSIEYLTSHPSSRPDLTFLAKYNGTTLIDESQHLACFDGGNFILGGQVLGQQKYIDFGLSLVAGCEDTYNSTLTHIGPEDFAWNATVVPDNQTALYEAAGFYIVDGSYILRPEVMESFYYAYRATGEQVYRDWAWNAFVAINATTRVGSGFSEITDVNAPDGGNKTNFQDSFLFAEVLKYAYLIQAPVSVDSFRRASGFTALQLLPLLSTFTSASVSRNRIMLTRDRTPSGRSTRRDTTSTSSTPRRTRSRWPR